MTSVANIKAAIAHLEAIAAELEAGAEHDVERLASDVRDFLHLGAAAVTSRRAEAPAIAAAAIGTKASAPAADAADAEPSA